jgi:hypothetical protein
MRSGGIVPLLFAAAALAACTDVSPYPLMVSQADSPDSYGYSDEKLDEGLYRVTYVGPNLRTKTIRPQWVERAARHAEDTAYELALWRAARISLQKGYPALRVTETFTDLKSHIVGRDYTTAFNSAGLNVVMPIAPGYYASTYFWPKVTLTVEMSDEVGAEAFDAKETAERLEQKYAYDGRRVVAANTYYYFGPHPYFYDGEDEEEAGRPFRRKPRYAPGYMPHGAR